jgi:Lon protease-like protein
LDDDPYPLAVVEPWCEDPPDAALTGKVADLMPRFRTALALAAELDEWSVPLTMELDVDPQVALYQMCAASPLGPHDRQRLLCAGDCGQRAEELVALLDELVSDMRRRLAGA